MHCLHWVEFAYFYGLVDDTVSKLKCCLNSSVVTAFSIFDLKDEKDKDNDDGGCGGGGSGPMCCMRVSVISALHVLGCVSGIFFNMLPRSQPCLDKMDGSCVVVGIANSIFQSGFERFNESEHR